MPQAFIALPVSELAPAVARANLARLLGEWGAGDIFTPGLLVGEVVTNAVQHGRGVVSLTVIFSGGRLRCEVRDCNPAVPVVLPQSAEREHGRGMEIVTALADDWGAREDVDGKTVWFELSMPMTGRAEGPHRSLTCAGCGCLVERSVVLDRCSDPVCCCARLPHADVHE